MKCVGSVAILLFALWGGQALARDMGAADPRIWLEETGTDAVSKWIDRENRRTERALVDTPLYQELFADAREALLTSMQIPSAAERGGYVYDVERSKEHPKGVWRRALTATFLDGKPVWRPLLDLDRLSHSEGRSWTFRGSDCLPPEFRRCVLTLSDGGSDASVRREFDLESGFIGSGFSAPAVKGETRWLDEDRLIAALAIGEDDSTSAGYPARVRLWRRGQSVDAAPSILEAAPGDIRLALDRLEDAHGNVALLINQEHDFSRRSWWLVNADGNASKLPFPEDARVLALQNGQLVFLVEKDAETPSGLLRAGGLYSAPLDELMGAERLPLVHTVFEPTPRQSLSGVESARTDLLFSLLENVTGKIMAASFDGERWRTRPIVFPDNLNLTLGSVDDRSDLALISGEGFLTPRTLFALDVPSGQVRALVSAEAGFDASPLIVERHDARSRDGTMVPYFIVRRKDAPLDGTNPTHMFAYGGFGYSLTPFYSSVTGKLWLERGGIYVQANLRGGGEFGPEWHQAATGTNRQNAYDDLVAVAEDLIRRGYTNPERLGFMGGSNGGLLAGVTYNQRPDLWGAVVAGGPLLDMLRYDQLLAGASWRSEYGDPADPVEGAFLRSISPYHNVDPEARHPPILLVTSSTDDRVHPGHARKFAELLREKELDYWFYENAAGGHAGASFYDDMARQQALFYTFFSRQLMASEER